MSFAQLGFSTVLSAPFQITAGPRGYTSESPWAVARGNAASVLATAKSSATGPRRPHPVRATLPPPLPRSLAPETSPPSKPAPPPETIPLPDKVSPHQTVPQPDPAPPPEPPPEPAQLIMLPPKAAVLPPSVGRPTPDAATEAAAICLPCCRGPVPARLLADDCLWGCHAPSDYPSRFPTSFFFYL